MFGVLLQGLVTGVVMSATLDVMKFSHRRINELKREEQLAKTTASATSQETQQPKMEGEA